MKKYAALVWFFASCFAFCATVTAQEPGDAYAFKTDWVVLMKINPYTGVNMNPPDTVYGARRGHIFTIGKRITVDNVPGYCISFWHFNKNGQQVSEKYHTAIKADSIDAAAHYVVVGREQNDATFFISEDVFAVVATSNFRKPRSALRLDGIVIPIKLRFRNAQPGGEFDFTQSINIGPAVSFNKNLGGAFGKSSVSLLFGVNVTNVSVDEKTAPTAVTSKTTMFGLSPFTGLNVTLGGIDFSVLSGFDILTGKAGRVWAYRNSPWLGFGIGVSIISGSSKKQE